MIKVLILCKNFETAKIIINKIVYNIDNMKVIGMYNNLNQIPNAIKNTNPDLIITTNKDLITLLKSKKISYTQGIILISNTSIEKYRYKNILVVNVHLSFKKIADAISSFLDTNFNISRKEKITNILKNLGFDFKLSGTIYLVDAILYVSSFKGYYSYEKIYKDIYTYVSKQNSTNVDRVKWSIARTINYMYKRHTKDSYKVVEKYFGVYYPERPTPKTLIGFIANDLDL